MAEVINVSSELVNYTKVKVLCNTNIHWFHINNKALTYCILLYKKSFLVIYMVLPNNNYNIMNHNRNM